MKIFAYRVVQKGPRTFEAVLKRLNEMPLPDRYFMGTAEGLRLEAFGESSGLVLADIASTRSGHGPGKIRRDAPMEEIPMGDGEAFGEDTGIVYDPVSGYMALQYNHTGPRIGRIQAYLMAADASFGQLRPAAPGESQWDRCGFQFGAVLKRDAYDRLNRMGIIKRLDFAVSLPGVMASDLDMGRSLGQVLNAPLPEGIENIEIDMKASRRSEGRLGRDLVMSIVEKLQTMGPLVTKAEVVGRRDEDSATEPVDLVEERLSHDAPVPVGQGQRFPRAARWEALAGILRIWLDNGDLQVLQ